MATVRKNDSHDFTPESNSEVSPITSPAVVNSPPETCDKISKYWLFIFVVFVGTELIFLFTK